MKAWAWMRSNEEIAALLHHSTDAGAYKRYADVGADNPLWDGVSAPTGAQLLPANAIVAIPSGEPR